MRGYPSGVATSAWPEAVQRVTSYLRDARAAGTNFARIAGSEEVRESTGFDPGAVAPFPLDRVDVVLVERTLLSQPVLWIGAGSERHMAAISPTELLRLSRARPMDVVEQAPYHST